MRSRMDSAAPPNKVPRWLDWSGYTISTTDISGGVAGAVLPTAAVGAGCAQRGAVRLGKRRLLQKEGKAPAKKRANQGETRPWAHKVPAQRYRVAILAQGHPALSHKNRRTAGLLALGSPCAITFPAKKASGIECCTHRSQLQGIHSYPPVVPFSFLRQSKKPQGEGYFNECRQGCWLGCADGVCRTDHSGDFAAGISFTLKAIRLPLALALQ